MRSAILLSLGAALLAAASNLADDKAPKAPPKEPARPSKDGYVKVRVEVEVRGVLTCTDKAVTVAARDRMYEYSNDDRELPDRGRPLTAYSLDFTRATDLRELARALDGKEVVATGLSELRTVMTPSRPGGVTGPGGSPGPSLMTSWSLQRTVEVTGLKSAPR